MYEFSEPHSGSAATESSDPELNCSKTARLPSLPLMLIVRLRISNQRGGAFAEYGCRNCARSNDTRMPARAIDDRRRRRWDESAAVQHPQCAARNLVRPLIHNLGGGLSRRNPRPVGARRGQRASVSANDAGDSLMAGPANGDSTFWSTQPRWHPALPTAEHESQRTGPARRDKARGVGWQMEVEPVDHGRSIDQQQKRLARRTTLERYQGVDGFTIDCAPEAIDRLRRIGEHQTVFELCQGWSNRLANLVRRPERNGEGVSSHPTD